MNGYQRFKKAGELIKQGKSVPRIKYEDMDVNELRTKRQEATTWLEENEGHPRWVEALERYEKIMDELEKRGWG